MLATEDFIFHGRSPSETQQRKRARIVQSDSEGEDESQSEQQPTGTSSMKRGPKGIFLLIDLAFNYTVDCY